MKEAFTVQYDVNQYIELIRSTLSAYRCRHSMCVADAAVRLAEKYGADKDRAFLAGLLHDITKEMPPEEQVEWIQKGGLPFGEVERHSRAVYHQMSGAVYVRDVLHIEDPQIFGAIRYHTTACAGMTLLEKVIYLADFISDDRQYPDVEVMRAKAYEGLDAGMLYALEYTIKDVVRKHNVLHPDTTSAYNEIIMKEK